MYLIAIAVLFIIIAELYMRSQPKRKSEKRKQNPKVSTWHLYLFIGTAVLSLVTILVYILNADLYGGQDFILGFIIGIPVYLVIFGIMVHAARAIIKEIYFENRLLIAAVILAAASIVMSAIEISATF